MDEKLNSIPVNSHLLVVDNDETRRTMLAQHLEQLNFFVAVVKDWEQGLNTPQTQPFDLIFFGIAPPYTDNFDA